MYYIVFSIFLYLFRICPERILFSNYVVLQLNRLVSN